MTLVELEAWWIVACEDALCAVERVREEIDRYPEES